VSYTAQQKRPAAMASRRLAPFVCSAAHYVEPRLLLHDKEKSYGDAGTGNLLIHGDNLLALRALLPKYGGRVKCIAAFFKNHVTLFDFRRIKRQKSKKRPASEEKKRWS